MKNIFHRIAHKADLKAVSKIAPELPQLYYKADGLFADVVNDLEQLQMQYRPTPWLSNHHAHIVFFDMIKKNFIHLKYDLIESLTMSDGGITAIAWFGLDLPEDTPTIVLLHTITGTPDSMRELVRDLSFYTGWRVALCVRRGHDGLPLPVPKINLFGSVEDLKEQLNFIQTKLPHSDLYAVGSSAGTGLLVRYLGEEAENTPIKAAFALCPGYNTETGFKNVHPIYSKIMTKKLIQKFILPYRETWQQIPDWDKILHVKTLAEFEKNYYKMAGFDDYESYVKASNPIYVFEDITVPLMILNAENDPVCSIKNLELYKEPIMNMPNIMVVTTKKGSHCGFYEGTFKTTSWATRLMAEFLLHQKN